jgi:hypothetical protein
MMENSKPAIITAASALPALVAAGERAGVRFLVASS